MIRHARTIAWIAAALIVAATPIPARAQQRSAKADAPLVVEGTVKQVFRAAEQGQSDYLLEIEVSRSEARPTATASTRSRFPGPGEPVYVRVSQTREQPAKPLAQQNRQGLPAAGAKIRAYLAPGKQGGWEAATADWYELAGEAASEIDPADLVREAIEKSRSGTGLGMTTELIKVEDRFVLRVTSVERGGPAQNSGLEVGDVIATADGAEITTANQLVALAANGKKIALVVIDVNTGRGARIEVDPKGQTANAEPSETAPADKAPAQPSPPARVSLGLSAEPVTLGGRSALKVIRVDPAGPAAKAGIEPGDVVVAANGAPTTGVEQLLNALRKSGPTLKLTVRDSRTSRDVDVEVKLGETAAAAPSEVDTPIRSAPGKLGAVTELAFHDSDFAVKVAEVEPGSAAARAGLRAGVLIVAADGKPVLHPNDLNDAVRNSKGTLKLTVVDPASGKKTNLDLSLR